MDFEPSGFFALRTPLLPIDAWTGWIAAHDQRSAIGALATRADVRDALHLASPSLLQAIDAGDEQRAERAIPKLAAYLTRASTRCTPFGLFAGCSVGTVGEETRLELDDRATLTRHTRLDNDYLFALVAALEADPELRSLLVWEPNSSLYRAGGRWRYAEARLTGTMRTYHLVAVDDVEALDVVLSTAGSGATIDELVAALAKTGITTEDAGAFVNDVIDAQLVVSNLGLQVTGPEPLETLIATLLERAPRSSVAACLDRVRDVLRAIDAAGVGATDSDYASVAEAVGDLAIPVEPGRFMQVDMMKRTTAASLGPAVVSELGRAIGILHCVGPTSTRTDLDRFRDAFVERYEDREIPLMEALDEEIGVGFGVDPAEDLSSPLLAGLALGRAPSEDATFTARDRHLLAMLLEATRSGTLSIELTDVDLEALGDAARLPLPDALEIIATVAATSAAEVDGGDFRVVVHGVGGAPGARLLGRFCHADAELRRHVDGHLRREEALQPDLLFAEVVHLPDGRLGNVLCRPVLRGHELVYLGRSGAPAERRLSADDLRVSVRAGRIVLRSNRLDREVVPRLTTAHAFGPGNLGVYRFLCSLQSQGRAGGLAWSWGALAGAPFLPRVTSGRIVLARARWTLRGDQLRDLGAAGLPRLVALVDGDNELVCDLDSPLSLAALSQQLRGRDEAEFAEVLPGPDEQLVIGPDGRYAHELVVPFVRTSPVTVRSPTASRPSIPRRFVPGSEWTFAKLYTGTGSADRVLVDAVRPLVERAMGDGVTDRWFFLRYGDPAWHLRLRMHGEPGGIEALLHDALAPLLEDGIVWRVQLDTYEREAERYGGDSAMELSELLFHHDSEAVLSIVERLAGDEGMDARWRLVLLGTDHLLDDFGFTLDEKLVWSRGRRDGFRREFGVDKELEGQLGRRYREERVRLEELLSATADGDHPLAPGIAILDRRSEALVPIAGALRDLDIDVHDLLASYAHMFANRLLRSAHRAQELVLHDLLHRLHQAQAHRARP